MTVKEFMSILSFVDSDMEILIEGRDSTGEYSDTEEMIEKNAHTSDKRVVIVVE